MPKFFITQSQIVDKNAYIEGQDVNHIKKVLRYKTGDKIEICNKDTEENFLGEIQEIQENIIRCSNLIKIEKKAESNIKITIFQGLPKADKMELVIQKSVELGVFEITPLKMKRCVVKLNEKDLGKKIERWQKISEVAAKQCERDYVPKINLPTDIKKLCAQIKEYDLFIVAYEKEDKKTLKEVINKFKQNINTQKEIRIGIVIGPEGGIDQEEINNLSNSGAQVVTLGKRILRTETVALNVLSILMYELENI